MESFGDIIKQKRKNKRLLLREAAALLEIDQAIISKFERGERKPSREQVLKFAKIYKLEADKLIISWLSDKVAYEIKGEKNAQEILKLAETKIKYLKSK